MLCAKRPGAHSGLGEPPVFRAGSTCRIRASPPAAALQHPQPRHAGMHLARPPVIAAWCCDPFGYEVAANRPRLTQYAIAPGACLWYNGCEEAVFCLVSSDAHKETQGCRPPWPIFWEAGAVGSRTSREQQHSAQDGGQIHSPSQRCLRCEPGMERLFVRRGAQAQIQATGTGQAATPSRTGGSLGPVAA
jgi:hypothetical protein